MIRLLNFAFARVLAVAAFGVLSTAQPVLAHDGKDALAQAPKAAAVGAPTERLAGAVHRLTIDDRVAGMVIESVTLEIDGGGAVALEGAQARNLQTGARVEATGRRNGRTLFVDDVRQLAASPAAAPGAQKSAARKSVRGRLAILHADYFNEGRSEFILEVHEDNGAITPLKLPVVPPALSAGMGVEVEGREAIAGDALIPDVVVIESLPATVPKKTFEKATRTNNVLVILMLFTNLPSAPFSQSAVQNVFSGSSGVSQYFDETSFGQQLLNPTVTPWLQTNAAVPLNCNYQQIGTLGRSAANAAGYNSSSYQNLVYVFPQISACGWVGLGYVGASGAWINGRNTTLVYGHELGHNFGLRHAGSVRCSAGAIGGSCSVSEYGDPFNVMGNVSTMHFNAEQKLDLGWITSGSVVTHSAGTATYTLNPIELAGGSLYAIRIPAFTNRTYWLEYRQPIGFDAPLASYPNNGAQVRVASPFETLCSGCGANSNDTQILDMTPGTGSFNDAALTVGQSYTDVEYGIGINVLSSNASGLTVQVTRPGGSTTATTTTLSSSANPSTVGSVVTFTATVTGSSPTGTVSFTANASTISGCGAIALGGSGNSRTAACSTATLPVGVNSIGASYGGDASNTPSASAALSQVVNSGSTSPNIWVDDAAPAGATLAGDGEGWSWVSGNPSPYSGALAHQSALGSGVHQHYFYGAGATLAVNAGDSLYTYIYLDAANPPSEVMLQWNDGSWEHRAYWGSNLIGLGVDGTVSRRYMGPLPAAGQWVRLEVPAVQVGLEGRTLNGMAFTLYGGRATWDQAGKSQGSAPPTSFQLSGITRAGGSPLAGVSFSATNGAGCSTSDSAGQYACTVPQGWSGSVTPSLAGYTFTPPSRSYSGVSAHQSGQDYAGTSGGPPTNAWVDDAAPAGATLAGDGEGWSWVSSNPAPFSGALAHQSALVGGVHQHYFYGASATLSVNAGDTLYAYVYLDPANPPSEVMLQWSDGSWEHRAYWGSNLIGLGVDGTVSRRYMGPLPAAGQWVRLEVAAAQVGLEGRTLNGMAFTLYGGRATWDQAGKSQGSSPPPPTWVEDAVPQGATLAGDAEGWTWVSSNPAPFSGALAHQSALGSGVHQHYFYGAGATLAVNAGDSLYTYIYLDAANPPSEVMLQWNDGSWEHRAYWGSNLIGLGVDGTASRRYMGPLPATGQWVRLEVPAVQVGLEGRTLNGMAFTLYGGRATWDAAGK